MISLVLWEDFPHNITYNNILLFKFLQKLKILAESALIYFFFVHLIIDFDKSLTATFGNKKKLIFESHPVTICRKFGNSPQDGTKSLISRMIG